MVFVDAPHLRMSLPMDLQSFLINNKSTILNFYESLEQKEAQIDTSPTSIKSCSKIDENSFTNSYVPRFVNVSCSPPPTPNKLNEQRRRYYQIASSYKKLRNRHVVRKPEQLKYENNLIKPCRCVGIFGMSQYTDEKDLHRIFSEFGQVEKINIIRDRYNQRSRGFGFVYLRTIHEAEHAIKVLSNAIIDGHQIRIDYSATNPKLQE